MEQNHRNQIEYGARPVTRRLHPRVYGLVIALTMWFVLSVWLFAGGGVTDYLLFIVSAFIFVAVALPLVLSRVARIDDADDDAAGSYRKWAAADFDTWQGRLSGLQATVQILLPIAAVAIGMTILGVALHVAEHEGPLQPLSAYSLSSSAVKNPG
jgi:hypothetical protein